MEKIEIGQVVNVVGLKGELKVYHYTDYKERFEELSVILLENKEYQIDGVRYMKDLVILKLEGINDRNEAEKQKGKSVYIRKEDIRVLPEDTYHIFDLIGLKVIDENDRAIGTLSDVIQNSAQDLYEVETENKKKFLIPAVEEFILEINIDEKFMRIKLIEGLMDLDQ
ncbi:ribosome maturation factor RimM [Sinanaerobacter chloroacetimidivorans]|jgi:16S rRNA processing protein RimM|uniref:Ribosome maturation factor RimM n=1 Tax=Sinanaerobacter chloroacetimidivorans TaxID=2818044 RepID=A0A8J7VY18_9FIRM|nr:ribosome maturation factor RimM [Sinanaerobacter chloroacetimidivorans]MBR0596796.1 16S rRNA processing protein RimM [Sinanaerobacter chloroacetimidivorans]